MPVANSCASHIPLLVQLVSIDWRDLAGILKVLEGQVLEEVDFAMAAD